MTRNVKTIIPRNRHIDLRLTDEVFEWVQEQAAEVGLRPGTWLWTTLVEMSKGELKSDRNEEGE